MKNALLSFLLLFSFSAFAQTKQQDIEKLITVLQIKRTIQNMVIQGIQVFKKQKPVVSQQVWDKIEKSVDYSPYMIKVAAIFNENYTQFELKHIITLALNAKPGKQPKLKPLVKEHLYKAGNEFGKQFAKTINAQLTSYGY